MLVAGVAKLRRLAETAIAWQQHRVLPSSRIPPLVRLVATTELSLALLLLVPATSVVGAWLAAALFLLYAAYLAAAVRSGARGGCACFGLDRSSAITAMHIWRALAFSGVAGVAALSPERETAFLAHVVGGLLGLSCVLVSTILVMVADTLSGGEAEA